MNSDHFIKLAHKVGIPIEKLSAVVMTKLKGAPQAQKRTAKFKKAVYIVDDLVFKGPYTCDDHGLIKNLRYTYAIELLEAALQLHKRQRGSLRWEYVGCWDDNQHYLVAPNVGKWENIPSELVSTKIETNVKVVPRGKAVRRVSDMESTGQLTDDIKLATLQHLYLRFLLDIGDSGTYNVLIREDHDSSGRLIAGIDLEEEITDNVKVRRSKEKNRRLNLLFSKVPFPKHISLYQSDVCKIKSLSYSQLDQHTLNRLNAVGIDLERLKWNMELWVRTPI
jgi:hypothetical protein